ncbi:MAG: hypothetical protein D6712_21020 [Chloroflexi bacterium]|nr:MAG: hypothetical protein D6712_21020 [Chloroflexota bacterium]
MDLDELIRVADAVVRQELKRPLSDLERYVLQESLKGKSYEQMTDGWAFKTVKDAGSRLWKCFSQSLGDGVKVQKSTFQMALVGLSERMGSRSTEPTQAALLPDLSFQKKVVDFPVNPFGDRGCITDPSRFFDREEILRQVFEALHRGASVSLVGESQIGKSSLLAMICAYGPAKLQLLPTAFTLLNMQWIRDEADLFVALCQEWGIDPPCRGYALRRKLKDTHHILCLDEVERMIHADDFSGRERTELRGLADGAIAPLTLVTASRLPLSQLFPDSPEQTSPLAGICQTIQVEPFSPAIAQSFIAHRLRDSPIQFTSAQIHQLTTQSQGHPARLQESAADLYRQLSEA